jgi:hypothetical protein
LIVASRTGMFAFLLDSPVQELELPGLGGFGSQDVIHAWWKSDSWRFSCEFRPFLRKMEQSLSTVTVEECVTQNVYGGGARNRKWLR